MSVFLLSIIIFLLFVLILYLSLVHIKVSLLLRIIFSKRYLNMNNGIMDKIYKNILKKPSKEELETIINDLINKITNK